jgi:hypothetical protein
LFILPPLPSPCHFPFFPDFPDIGFHALEKTFGLRLRECLRALYFAGRAGLKNARWSPEFVCCVRLDFMPDGR